MNYKEKVIALLNSKELTKEQKEKLEDIFPKLKESEDDRIRKAIINFLHEGNSFKNIKKETRQRWIAWLEKQAEHANFRNKIQIGDKVTRNEDDVLVNLSQLKRVAKKDENQGEQKPAWSEEDEKVLQDIIYNIRIEATKHLPSPLTKGKSETDLYIDWLRSLKNKLQFINQEWSKKDEDKLNRVYEILPKCIDCHPIECKELQDWLNSLKDRVQPQPKEEWSEEDERVLCKCLGALGNPNYCYEDRDLEHMRNWLKSLRPQNKYAYNPYKAVVESIAEMCVHYANSSDLEDFYDNVVVKCKDAKEYDSLFPQNHWKPSDEQIDALFEAHKQMSADYHMPLLSLYNDLKKLREE